jgi:hypothetical protein
VSLTRWALKSSQESMGMATNHHPFYTWWFCHFRFATFSLSGSCHSCGAVQRHVWLQHSSCDMGFVMSTTVLSQRTAGSSGVAFFQFRWCVPHMFCWSGSFCDASLCRAALAPEKRSEPSNWSMARHWSFPTLVVLLNPFRSTVCTGN